MADLRTDREAPAEQSAGGVIVWKSRILLVFQTRTQTWSFPKGHLEGEEVDFEAAVREIEEESGLRDLELLESLGSYERGSRRGPRVRKRIHLYLFRSELGNAAPVSEDVANCVWFSLDEAVLQLSYEEERKFLERNRREVEGCFVD